MRKTILFILSAVFIIACSNQSSNCSIYINSLGYKPESIKKATVIGEKGSFKVVDLLTKQVVFNGVLDGPYSQADVTQTVFIADFSNLKTSGEYYIELDSKSRSEKFVIAEDAYNFAFKTSMRAFYLWRCGTAVEGVFGTDTFKQEACHMHDGYYDYTEFGAMQSDGVGGWHDAGDYGKYIVNGGLTLGQLFMGWQDFKESIGKVKLEIPNKSKALPDFLEELKWETDWFLKMQYPDNSGRISHKLTRLNFSGFIMPNEDTENRYFSTWGTGATAHFIGAMALATRNFEPYDSIYSRQCLDAAKNSYRYLKEHPEYIRWDQQEFHTGGYHPNETDGLIWAAAEMWETSGEEQYLKDFEERIIKVERMVENIWDWGNVKNLGVYTYLLSERDGKNKKLYAQLRNDLVAVADSIVDFTVNDIYGRPSDYYDWGSNGAIARLASNLYVASKLNNNRKYKDAAESILAHLFGRNYYGRSYVTSLGVNPPMHPHDRRCGGDSIINPWPGYIVGGGHTATDWVDEEGSYSHNETAINWQASLVYLLAWVNAE